MKTLILALVTSALIAAVTAGAATAGPLMALPQGGYVELPSTGGTSGSPDQS